MSIRKEDKDFSQGNSKIEILVTLSIVFGFGLAALFLFGIVPC